MQLLLHWKPQQQLLIISLLLSIATVLSAPINGRKIPKRGVQGPTGAPVSADTFQTDGKAFLLKFGYLDDCAPPDNPVAAVAAIAKAVIVNSSQHLAELHELLNKPSAPAVGVSGTGPCPRRSSKDLASALLAFQAAYELPRTGRPDPPTLDAMNERRCGLADSPDALDREADRVPANHRDRRSVLHSQLPSADRLRSSQVTWELVPGRESKQLPRELQRRLLAEAFRSWAAVSPISFKEIPAPASALDWSGRPAADISVSFERLQHGTCPHAFDGRGKEVSHARAAGPIHVDADEIFSDPQQQQQQQQQPDKGEPGVDLRRVFIHEIGHTLGLLHSGRVDSVMHPANVLLQGGPAPQIGAEERRLVQENYGVCAAKINSAFDWIRADPQHGYPVFNTYFFSCQFYWLFENSAGRPRQGDPLPVGRGWPGVPDGPDAALELVDFDPAGKDNTYLLFFFSGNEFLEFDSVQKAAKPGYPKKIADNFGPKPGYAYGIPDGIDGAFYDYATGLVHFFKGIWVFIYSPGSARSFKFNNCCESVRKISDRFPTAPGDKPLQTPIDSVYFRLADGGLYFFSGQEVWQDVAYSPYRPPDAGPVVGLLRYRGRVSDKWPDLCFPEPSKCDLSDVKLMD